MPFLLHRRPVATRQRVPAPSISEKRASKRGTHGEIRPRVPGVRVSTRWKAEVRKQLELQERHDDPERRLAAVTNEFVDLKAV